MGSPIPVGPTEAEGMALFISVLAEHIILSNANLTSNAVKWQVGQVVMHGPQTSAAIATIVAERAPFYE